MKQHRCPWCGEKVESINSRYNIARRCRCGKKYQRGEGNKLFILLCFIELVGTIFGVYLLYKDSLNMLIGISLFILIMVLIVFLEGWRIDHMPTQRVPDIPWTYYLATAQIDWNSTIHFPLLSVISGEIFPACFVDENGRPVSAMWCVVVRDMQRKKGRYTASIEFVLPQAPVELLHPSSRFRLFYDETEAAQGEVMSFEPFLG